MILEQYFVVSKESIQFKNTKYSNNQLTPVDMRQDLVLPPPLALDRRGIKGLHMSMRIMELTIFVNITQIIKDVIPLSAL